MHYYRLLGKKIVLTVHNVNAARRDSRDSHLNRLTLRAQYRLADHIFVHTEEMKKELVQEFAVQETAISVIPFGINNAVPNTRLTHKAAKERLGILDGQKAILFFGNIAPYKGLEYLIAAFRLLLNRNEGYRLIIAGCPKNCDEYWAAIQRTIQEHNREGRILLRADYIPDDETEVFFKAADVLVLPYRHIYQSGVLFLSYSFGLPVIAANVGSLKDEIVEGETGFVFRPEDPTDLARTIETYFESDLYANLSNRREQIEKQAAKKHSWRIVGQITCSVYCTLSNIYTIEKLTEVTTSKSPSDLKASR
jgi:glycosyltransferase involved in cell wall biosynthesis